MVTNTPADPGERIVHFDHSQGIIPASFPDQGDISLGALSRGAGIPAGSDAVFLDGVGVGDGLGIELEDRPSGC